MERFGRYHRYLERFSLLPVPKPEETHCVSHPEPYAVDKGPRWLTSFLQEACSQAAKEGKLYLKITFADGTERLYKFSKIKNPRPEWNARYKAISLKKSD